MANPISVPGTVIPSGSLISPGGAQGLQGLQGTTALADVTQNGLLHQTSGNTGDYLGGDNTFHSLVATLAALLVPTGSVLSYAGSTAPNGFLLCNGAAVSRATYSALFTLIGTTFGTGLGDGLTFSLPDLRGRVAVGAGQGTSLTNRVLAASGGEEAHPLTIAELAAHTHSDSGHTHSSNCGTQPLGTGGAPQLGNAVVGSGANINIPTVSGNANIQATGSGTAHNTMPPFSVLNYIIKT